MRHELRPLLEEMLLSGRPRTADYLDPTAVRRLALAHIDGGKDHSAQLWSLLWLEMWHREFFR
jgi:hypothetical protein